jgi:hypothetical protein
MKNVLVERSSKERIESISVGDLKFSMHDEFEYADGGIIIGLYDNDMIRKEYEEGDWDVNEAFFSLEDDENVPFDKVACKLDIREGDGGYVYYFDNDGNELYEN